MENFKLPVDYTKLSQQERRIVREQYIKHLREKYGDVQ